jgi:hypothetical protein
MGSKIVLIRSSNLTTRDKYLLRTGDPARLGCLPSLLGDRDEGIEIVYDRKKA